MELARTSIEKGLCGEILSINLDGYSAALRIPRASFVTLHVDKGLRGCIGSLQAARPLATDVVQNAYAAAFRDPRFAALTRFEFDRLDIHISVLSDPQPMQFKSEEDLLAQLRPGVDGLILSESRHRGTFLPAVWDSLPDRREFLRHLKHKAGLSPDYWSDTLQIERYTADSIP